MVIPEIAFDPLISGVCSCDGTREIIYFCPACGHKAPLDRRKDFFTHISEAEVQQLADRLRDVKTVEQVIEALGEPDETYPYSPLAAVAGREKRPKKQTLVFTTRWRTLRVTVTEYLDGTINVSASAQYRGLRRQ